MSDKVLPTISDLTPVVQGKHNELLNQIVEEDDFEELKNLTHKFNAHQAKRQILRVNALNNVQDALISQMIERLTKTPDNFANKDISDWMKVVQMVMDVSQKGVEHVDEMPTIINQQNTQVNINVADSLPKESRDRITEAIKLILQGSDSPDGPSVFIDEEHLEEVDESSLLPEDQESETIE